MAIGIVNTGMGNIGSIRRMISKVGGQSVLVSNPEHFIGVTKIILPGVGHFNKGIQNLRASGIEQTLRDLVFSKDLPILGICLGMHLLCRNSEEGGEEGLGFVDATVKKIDNLGRPSLKIPHMGWNAVSTTRDNPLLPITEKEQRFYFVHSYLVDPKEPGISTGNTLYGYEFCSAFQKNNIYGVQFHPEKSHRFGMALMKRFLDL